MVNPLHKVKLTTKHQIQIATVVGIAAGAVIVHKLKVNQIIEQSREAVEWTMGNSFNEGVKHGLALAKELGLGVSQTSMQDLYELGRPLNQGTLS